MKKLAKTFKINKKLLFTNSSMLNHKDLRKKKQVLNRAVGYTLVVIQILIAIVFLGLLFSLNIIPNKYMLMIVIVLLLLTAYNLASQFTVSHIMGKVLAIILSAALFTGSIYVYKTNGMLDSISGSNTEYQYYSIIVLNTDNVQSLADVKNYTFGYNYGVDSKNSERAIAQVNKQLDTTVINTRYDNWSLLVNGLYDQSVNTIILNESYRSEVQALFADFNDRTKVIDTVKVETKITEESIKDVITEPFSIYIAGNDESTDLDTSGRNDVNIIATFNPETRQVLLVTTPRDYWVNVYSLCEKGIQKDKLTHAGNFGIDASMTTLENLYGTILDYYVIVNFSGTVGIVNALDGIDINSEIKFTTCDDTAPIHYTFNVGKNANCDGAKALAFCRERQVFENGDNQRGRNQMYAIQGIIAKASSTSILKNYVSVMDSVSDMFLTSIPEATIAALIKDMLNDLTTWNVQTYNVTGTNLSDQNIRSNLYPNDPELQDMAVTDPDYATVSQAISLMSKVRSGEIFNLKEYLEKETSTTSESTIGK